MLPKLEVSRSILVVEDDAALRRVLEVALRRVGYEVLSVNDGSAAMEIVRTRAFDLFLVDFMMPIVDGASFLRWLRGEARVHAPALMLTAASQPEVAAESRAAGADDVVVKPIDLQSLIERISRLERR